MAGLLLCSCLMGFGSREIIKALEGIRVLYRRCGRSLGLIPCLGLGGKIFCNY